MSLQSVIALIGRAVGVYRAARCHRQIMDPLDALVHFIDYQKELCAFAAPEPKLDGPDCVRLFS